MSATRTKPSLRLFCLPYAGTGASIYKRWEKAFPPHIQVCAVQYPGREECIREQPLDRLDPLLEMILNIVEPQLDIPFAFFGHSLGALVAFELSHLLRNRGYSKLIALFVSACMAPHCLNRTAPIHKLSDIDLIEELRRLGGTPSKVLENTDLMQLFLPVIRADYAIVETYVSRPRAKLDCRMIAIGGTRDASITRDDLQEWDRYTSADFSLQFVEGDHFFIRDFDTSLVKTICQFLV